MPPQFSSDDDNSGSEAMTRDIPVRVSKAKPEKAKSKSKSKTTSPKVEEQKDDLMVESADDDDDDDDDVGEDVYVVEKITNHLVDEETGELLFEVKWDGYEKKSERTWEPEASLETASKILNEYLASVGGKDLILNAWEEKKAAAAGKQKGKKRGRTSIVNEAPTGKRSKRDSHPASATPPKSAAETGFKPPSGSWEDDVVMIEACEGSDIPVVVFLTWRTGQRTQHPLAQVYKRCPQKMLKFYESHLVFKKTEESN